MASPGAAIQAFCEPVTTRSMPQRVHLERDRSEARHAVDHDQRLGRGSRMAAARTGIGFMTPVEVSLWVSRTAR